MPRNAARIAGLSFLAAPLIALSGCCGVMGGCGIVYNHPGPSCIGLHYEGCCTYRDELRDRVNQLTDILIPCFPRWDNRPEQEIR